MFLKLVWEISLSPNCSVSYPIFTKSPRFGKYILRKKIKAAYRILYLPNLQDLVNILRKKIKNDIYFKLSIDRVFKSGLGN